MKYVTIGRHAFTNAQMELLAKAGLNEEITRFEMIEDVSEVVRTAKENNAVIVVQALPLPLLAQLLNAARREGVEVFNFRVRALDTVPLEKAEERARELGADIISPDPKSGNARISRTEALQKVLQITIVTEDVATR